jgi:hypothetical protein
MGIWDRDWYRDELRRRESLQPDGHYGPSSKTGASSRGAPINRDRTAWLWVVVLLCLMFAAALVVTDMKDRGVPFTAHGLRWWLSLWFGKPAS